MRLALTDLFRARWTEEIHEEWIRSVLESRPDLKREQLERTRALMNAHVRDCLVTDYQDLISALHLPDPDDRHVVAAAIRGRADVIVTYNLAEFPQAVLSQYAIEAQHPDEFVVRLFDLDEGAVCAAARAQRESLRKPPKTVEEYLAALERQGLAQTVTRLRGFANLL
jgi:predicted nucleic acid-binding protein